MRKALVYTLTITSAVVMGAAILISEIPQDTGNAVAFLVLGSFTFAALAGWTWALEAE